MPTTIKHKTSRLSHAFYVWVNKPGVLEDMEVKGISRAPSHDGLCLETLRKVVLEQEECREVGHVPCDAAQQ